MRTHTHRVHNTIRQKQTIFFVNEVLFNVLKSIEKIRTALYLLRLLIYIIPIPPPLQEY